MNKRLISTDADRPTRLADRYRLDARLGGGGMATVYRAFDERLHREVAVKLLDTAHGLDSEARRRFESEGRAAASINHPNVVAVYDVGVQDTILFIVMECVAGESLHESLRGAPMHTSRAIGVLSDVLAGLAAAHTQGVLHRDIKPANVLIDADGRAKLADFGIATSSTAADLTQTGLVVGTLAYLAPERVAGHDATVQSDLYAVGVIAYEALSGQPPFDGDTPLALAHAIHGGVAPRLHELRPDLPPALCDAVMGAMSVDPTLRPSTADAFARELSFEELASTDRIPAPADLLATKASTRPTTVAPTIAAPTRALGRTGAAAEHTRRLRPRRRFVVAAAGVALAIAGGSFYALARDDPGGPDPAQTEPSSPPTSGAPVVSSAPITSTAPPAPIADRVNTDNREPGGGKHKGRGEGKKGDR